MNASIRRLTAASVCALLLAACNAGGNSTPAAAPPSTWVVQAGASDQNEALQTLAFYPATITIDAGDSITWKYPAGEPHTVAFLGPKAAPPPPDDPSVPAPAGGSTYDGTAYTSSGFLLGGRTYTLTFPKAGTYTYYCLIHGEMVGTVVVQPKGAPYPASIALVSTQSAGQVASDLKNDGDAVALFPYTEGGPHIAAGLSSGLGAPPLTSSSIVRFLNGKSLADTSVSISAGATVTWTNLDSNLPHTVTIGPASGSTPQMNPFSPPSGGTVYDGTTLVNSGPLFGGQSFSVTFTKPGTYAYGCLFHDDTEHMTGTIVVH